MAHTLDSAVSYLPKITFIPWPYMCRDSRLLLGRHHVSHNADWITVLRRRRTLSLHQLTMHLIQINHECLLYLFTFLNKDSRKSVSLTCRRLREVFLDPHLWSLLHFSSPCQLRRDNFVLGPSLHYLSVCWHSSRVKVCNIEDWMKSTFQKDICSKHESLVSALLEQVCLT